MKTSTFFSRLLSTGMLSLMLGILGGQVAEAQRPVHLLSTTCVTTRGSSWRSESQDVAIGREVYTSVMYIWDGGGFSCRLKTANSVPQYQTLNLGFGLQDGSRNSDDAVLSVYLDGNQVGSRSISRGQAKIWVIDVTNARSVALEVTCPSGSCSSLVRFFEASLDSIPGSPGVRN
ncbi:hypothetical protein MC7420_4166 [Coleofasciculus chthonoplastes PCC 7420]|uniref:Glycosyl hydrolase family 98 putative carbohydrate-binding module domain-containing protein n=1 Tax=Coleofasciculus chthonoplastes PCC 7420 TaxID=118168 RepID=B4VVF5_9CYAN|nr:hypothetical protein [Coleofasciculus chthonoplastes]EDX74181.1 hypothetical protein MC7420_4166 [Coleofasciculus chthonoplastes PCC 7420]